MNNNEIYELTAKTLFGLEDLLAEELSGIGADDIQVLNRAVAFSGTMETMYRANLELRTAMRVFKNLISFRVHDEVELYKKAYAYNWSSLLNPNTTFAIDSTVYSPYFNHENYVALKVKDALVDKLRDEFGRRPDVDVYDPDIRLHVHISEDICTIALDSSGDSLHKRGYRIDQVAAPMNEVLAAGMIKLTGWNYDCDFIDPMCGSGTMLMEAATMAYNIAPGMMIDNFGFMKWKDFDQKLWEKLKDDAKSRERDFPHKIIGFDVSGRAIKIAKENIKHAGLGWKILLKTKKFEELDPEDLGGNGIAIINPPYGERLDEDEKMDLDLFYKAIGDGLKKNFDGFTVWIISSNKQALKEIGLRTSKKLTLFNGALECKYQRYDMYKGSRKSKYLNKEIGEQMQSDS